jgi:hypothetical protein
MEYAGRMYYMIQRRTVRDLIIRADSKTSGGRRKDAYLEIVKVDQDREKHFKDVTIGTEPVIDFFVRFLAAGQFLNGFDTMKWLGIASRIKWLKICALVWRLKTSKINDFKFDIDDKKTGFELDRRLQIIDEPHLNRYLAQIDDVASCKAMPDISISNQSISAFGFTFCNAKNGVIEISLD